MSNDKRQELADILEPVIEDYGKKATKGRIQDEKKSRTRIAYGNALARLITAYNQLLRDKELEEIQEELQRLSDEFARSKKEFKDSKGKNGNRC